MKVFVAGATGALGRHLVPELVARGHEVVGTTRTPAKQERLWNLGARAVVVDALDAQAVAHAVAEAAPDVVVHQLTALSGKPDFRHPDRFLALTNRLRTEGTDHLLAAAQAVGARRFVAQSYAGWPYARTGGPVKTEDDPLDPHPPAAMREAIAAIRHVEETVPAITWGTGVVLRYGGFYGPGTGLALEPGAPMTEAVRRGRFPLVGRGGGVWSFIHIRDAALATAAAIEGGPGGLYNVVDDDPAPVREWLPALTAALGARPPRRVPRWLARILAGEAPTVMMTEVRGASNAKAKTELGWRPSFASWRQGFAEGLG